MKIQQASRETFRAAQAGDLKARNEIIERNMGLIGHVAARLVRRDKRNWRHALRDRIQDGVLVMPRIIATFDPDRGLQFSTYAGTCLSRFLWRQQWQDRLIELPEGRDTQANHAAVCKAASEIEMCGDGHHLPVEDPHSHTEEVEFRELQGILKDRLSLLSFRQRKYIGKRLAGETLSEIGAADGVSRTRAQQIVDSAVHVMKLSA